MAKKDPYKSYDQIGLIFGVLGIIFCMTGIFGILFGGLGLFFAKHKLDTDTGRTARVMSIIAIVLGSLLLLFFVFSVIMSIVT